MVQFIMLGKLKDKILKKVLLVLMACIFSAMLIGSFFHYHSHSTVRHNGFPVKNECSVCSFIQLMNSSTFPFAVFTAIFLAVISRLFLVRLPLNLASPFFSHFSHAPPK